MLFRHLMALMLLAAGPALAQTCGDTETPCILNDGVYRISLPETPQNAPIAVYLHGYGGSGLGVIKNKTFVKRFTDRGYALVAPSGQADPTGAFKPDWAVDDGYDLPRDDITFIAQVLDDAATRFGLDRDLVLLTGFSRGGSMVWDIACAAPDIATAYAAASGGFWEPYPKACSGPVHLHHSHGFTDRTVPLEGRAAVFNGTPFVQGNILRGLDFFRIAGGCAEAATTSDIGESSAGQAVWEKRWTDCGGGGLVLSLWPGGHGLPKGWTDAVMDWFETIQRAQ